MGACDRPWLDGGEPTLDLSQVEYLHILTCEVVHRRCECGELDCVASNIYEPLPLVGSAWLTVKPFKPNGFRSEEHTSELQSR